MKLLGVFHDCKKHLNSYILVPTWFPSSNALSANVFKLHKFPVCCNVIHRFFPLFYEVQHLDLGLSVRMRTLAVLM